jgi:predicted permease
VLAVFNIIAPVFGIVLLGYMAVRFKLYPQEGVKGLVAFVNNFCTPCLLFEAMLSADFHTAFNFSILVPFYIGAFICFAIGCVVSFRVFESRPGDSIGSGFAGTFSNTVMMGIPIINRAFGADAMPVIYSIIAFHAGILITVAMVVMELTRRDGRPLMEVLPGAASRILLNPLLLGVVVGLACNILGVRLPEPGTAFFNIMSQAVLPTALFAIGGALNEYRISENWLQASFMAFLKLMVHPTIAYMVMVPVLHAPIEIARYGILLAAMPTGINAYVFATYYNRGVSVANSTILISTAAAVLTISFWLLFLG